MSQSDFGFRGVSPLHALLGMVRRITTPRYTTRIARSSDTPGGGGTKLPPIAEVLSRAGREPRAPE